MCVCVCVCVCVSCSLCSYIVCSLFISFSPPLCLFLSLMNEALHCLWVGWQRQTCKLLLCIWCSGSTLQWLDWVTLMHVCGVTAWHKWHTHISQGFFKYTCVFVTFRVHFTSVCLHYTHFNYKLSLSGSNTYTVFCFIPLALEILFHTTTNDSTSNLH